MKTCVILGKKGNLRQQTEYFFLGQVRKLLLKIVRFYSERL